MKLVSFKYDSISSIGVLVSSEIIDIYQLSNKELPNNMLDYLSDFEINNKKLKQLLLNISTSKIMSYNLNDVFLDAPLPNPPSFRDAYAFRKHVEVGRKNRGLDMIPEYDEFPVFYIFLVSINKKSREYNQTDSCQIRCCHPTSTIND